MNDTPMPTPGATAFPGSDAAPAVPRPILFLHIPKTAGTSFLTVLRNLFGDTRVLRLAGEYGKLQQQIAVAIQSRLDGLSCLTGHVPLHLVKEHFDKFRFFTILRDPVARVMSLYRFLQRAPDAELAELGLRRGFTFDDFVTCRTPGTYAQVCNGMCRLLSGDPRLDDGNDPEFWNMAAMPKALNAAHGFLERTDFGLAEEMGATLRLAQALWDVPFDLDEYQANSTEKGGAEDSVQNIRRVVELNTADIALYQAARAMFNNRRAIARPEPEPTGCIWEPRLNEECNVADMPGRQGFHDFETEGFAWVMSDARPRLHFYAPEGLGGRRVRIALRFYLITAEYPAERIQLRLNGQRLPYTACERDERWCTLEAEPIALGAGVQQLTIDPPYSVPVRFLEPGTRDLRNLSIALATVTLHQ
jgi:hypothetical protein